MDFPYSNYKGNHTLDNRENSTIPRTWTKMQTKFTIVNDIEAALVDLVANHPIFPPNVRVQALSTELVDSGHTSSVESVTFIYRGLVANKQANSMIISQNSLNLRWTVQVETFSSNTSQMAPTVLLELLRSLITGFSPAGVINPFFVSSETPGGFGEDGSFTWNINIETTVQQCTFTYYDPQEQPNAKFLTGFNPDRGINLCFRRVYSKNGQCYIMNACNPDGSIIPTDVRVEFNLYVSTLEEIGPERNRAILGYRGDNKATNNENPLSPNSIANP